MKLNQLFDRVVLCPRKNKDKSESGIFLPQESAKKSDIAEVIAVGNGGLFDGKKTDMQVCVGQIVMYSPYAGTEIRMDGKEYVILRQTDILGILED